MNTVFIVPTGVGAEIGGHAGDALPAAKLLAAVSDTLITHPNVVNASDINEMTENTLYVEGSMLDRFLAGDIELERVHHNRILLAVNAPVDIKTVNAVSAARATLGADIRILELRTPLLMNANMMGGRASGSSSGCAELVAQVLEYADEFDALAIATHVTVDPAVVFTYLEEGGVNPWGGVEAMVSKTVSRALNKPVAHAPFGDTLPNYNAVVDPRMAAELVSMCYLHCVLKGLHRAPRIGRKPLMGRGLSVRDVDCLITPPMLWGPPHQACAACDIPIIVVRENRTCFDIDDRTHIGIDEWPYAQKISVATYLEAAGVVAALRAGIDWRTVRRPLEPTVVIKEQA